MRSRMSKEEFHGLLQKHGLTQTEALTLIFQRTNVPLNLGNIQTHMERCGSMSAPYTVAFRLLFRELDNDGAARSGT